MDYSRVVKSAPHNNKTRSYDSIDDSFNDLMLVANYEPNIAQCMNIIYSTCLSGDINLTVNGKSVTKDFNLFMQQTYIPFLRNCIKCMYVCGFVAWHLKYDSDGDIVPECIPIGSFSWSTETKQAYLNKKQTTVKHRTIQRHESTLKTLDKKNQSYIRQHKHLIDQAQKKAHDDRIDSNLIYYKIKFIRELGLKEDDVEIFDFHTPSLTGNFSSSVQSPLLHILNDYKFCRETISMQSYADIWNTQARMVCSYQPAQNDKYSVNEVCFICKCFFDFRSLYRILLSKNHHSNINFGT
jgi:hypothetical protein